MPNNVQNIISLQGDKKVIDTMLKTIQNDKYGPGSMDFNKIISMPQSLQIVCGSITNKGLKAYREFLDTNYNEQEFLQKHADITSDIWNLGKTAYENIQQYGAPTWYEWSIEHWGTKWNAYGFYKEKATIEADRLIFQTAWNAPHPLIKRLSRMYPDVTFVHEWADEDIGANCGMQTYAGGKIVDEYCPKGINAVKFTMSLWGYEPEELGLHPNINGTDYVNIEADEYELIELFGVSALFTNKRLTAADVPAGLYYYHLRESDDGNGLISIEPKMGVNHSGTIIIDRPLDLREKGYILLTDETTPNFTGKKATIGEFLRRDFNMRQEIEQNERMEMRQ